MKLCTYTIKLFTPQNQTKRTESCKTFMSGLLSDNRSIVIGILTLFLKIKTERTKSWKTFMLGLLSSNTSCYCDEDNIIDDRRPNCFPQNRERHSLAANQLPVFYLYFPIGTYCMYNCIYLFINRYTVLVTLVEW